MSQEQSQKPPPTFLLIVLGLVGLLCVLGIILAIPTIVHDLGYAAGAITKAARDGYSAGGR